MNVKIETGMLLSDENGTNSFRVLSVYGGEAALCQVYEDNRRLKNKLVIKNESVQDIEYSIQCKSLFPVVENKAHIEADTMKPETRQALQLRQELVTRIVRYYGPTFSDLCDFKSKPLITDMSKQLGMSYAGARQLLIRYLQSGFNGAALFRCQTYRQAETGERHDTKKRGPRPAVRKGSSGEYVSIYGKLLNAEDYENFRKYVGKYLRSKKMTMKEAYLDMLDAEYIRRDKRGAILRYREAMEAERPSFRQFYYYLRKSTTSLQRETAKRNERDLLNNHRVFCGSVMSDVLGPGDMVEFDAHEMDISVVSGVQREKCVGRPTVYSMIDVYSRTILAVSVAFDVNSVIGLTNCLLNLVQDKVEMYKQLAGEEIVLPDGVELNEIWPSGFKPARIRYDRGSDYISDEENRILNELNITGEMVPPASGSLKGVVERLFEDAEGKLRELLANKGGISKEHGSKHHKEAYLDIKTVTKVVYDYVIMHNMNFNRGIKLSPQMIKSGLHQIPCEVWDYGIRNTINPEYIANKDEFIYSILSPVGADKATISRKGIDYKGLRYFCRDEDLRLIMFRQQNKKKTFICRTDPRDCSRLYYFSDGLKYVSLDMSDANMRSYARMTWKEYEELVKQSTRKEAKEIGIEAEVDFRRKTRNTIKAVSVPERYADTSDMRASRGTERNRVESDMSVFNLFIGTDEDEETAQKAIEYTPSDDRNCRDKFEEAMKNYVSWVADYE